MKTGRRRFVKLAAFAAAAGPALAMTRAPRPRLRIEEVRIAFAEHRYRAPYKFGGVPVDRATVLDVRVRAAAAGRAVEGFGSMPLGNVWSFPSRAMGYDTTLGAMRALAERIRALTAACREAGHPLELNHGLMPTYLAAADEVARALNLAEPIPKLCTLVTASPFDAALHDAFGQALGVSAYRTYTRELLGSDLAPYLGEDFRGRDLDGVLDVRPAERVLLFHSVGGADPVVPSDVVKPVGDGLPETLGDWIRRDGLRRIKIKLQGEALEWDVERTVAIDRVARETRPDADWKYCADFNERCPDVAYVLEYLRKVKERAPAAFDALLYLEQPTARDLRANPGNVLHEASKLRPVVIDESLTDLESLLQARAMGYTGVALKACKGQSHAVLMAAAARRHGMFLTVQDLTCPGAALIHSAGLAARVPGVAGIEANARQYMPAANAPWAPRFPGLFDPVDGALRTGQLTGPGLGAMPAGAG